MAAALVEFETIDTNQIDDLMARVPMREPADVVDSDEVSSELGLEVKIQKALNLHQILKLMQMVVLSSLHNLSSL